MDRLDEAWAAGHAAHPRLSLRREDFAAYLEARASAWTVDHAADAYLACACLRAVPGAAEAFSAAYLAKVPAYLGKLARSADFVAEVRQLLAMRLLVGDEEHPPHLGEYSGRGSLEGWVRIAATRTALNLSRSTKRDATWTEAVERRMVQDGGDLAFLKHAYREPFSRAVTQAAGVLSREHRMLLRLHYVEGVTTAQLAALYHVSRPTLVRRVGDASDALLAGVQRALSEMLRLDATEFSEVLSLVRSQLDVSLARLLRETLG